MNAKTISFDLKLNYESVKHFGYSNNSRAYRASKKVALREVARKGFV